MLAVDSQQIAERIWASMSMILAFLVGVIVGIVLTVGYAMAQAKL